MFIVLIHSCPPPGDAQVESPPLRGSETMTTLKSTKFARPLAELLVGSTVLKDVEKKYQFEDGKRTDKIDGYDYTVVDMATLDEYTVRVSGPGPIIDPKDLEKMSPRPEVQFSDDALVKPVKIEYGKVMATITASSISFVSKSK